MHRGAKKTIKATAVISIVALILLFYYFVASCAPALLPKCMFHELTGYNCPGCGLQRAIGAAIHGDFATALRYNYSLAVTIPVLALYGIAWMLRHRLPRLFHFLDSAPAMVVLSLALIAWWICRNVAGV